MSHQHISVLIAAILTIVTVAVLLFSPQTGAAGYGRAPDVPFEELAPKYHFLDKLKPAGITHLWMLASNTDGTHTLNLLPKRNLGKNEMKNIHEVACILSTHFAEFTLKGTAFYLPNGLLFGSPCVRADGKGPQIEKWGGSQRIEEAS
jgi:hypothetical protein